MKYQVFRGEPSAEDIQQGALGDCYFLSALAVVATRLDIINKIFVSKETSNIGAYQVRLCKDGNWQIITVDSLFPITKNGPLAYANGARCQLWPAILVKAFANELTDLLIFFILIEDLNNEFLNTSFDILYWYYLIIFIRIINISIRIIRRIYYWSLLITTLTSPTW